MTRIAALWLGLGWAAFALLPWYVIEGGGFFAFGWVLTYPDPATASALLQGLTYGRWWLLPLALPLLLPLLAARMTREDPRVARLLIAAGTLGLVFLFGEGFAIDHRGWTASWLGAIFGAPGPRQAGMGYGAAIYGGAALILLAQGFAAKGYCRGDGFTVGAIVLIVALITLFVFFPVTTILSSAVRDNDGNLALALFAVKFLDQSIWGLDCIYSDLRCGVAWNTLFLAVVVGAGSTLLGLAFALIAARTAFRFKWLLRVLTVLPIITPPFVIGLAVILLFGRSGAFSAFLAEWLDIPRSRWIYGLPGVAMAQLLAFTPIAFLVLIGVVQG
ncbi:MAG: iron ABC transporter permease, partial [Rhodospirillales bacterium]|nr:iron ABC transporter permease [Rhodospirillales bacterium]